MVISLEPIIYGLIFVGVLALVQGIYLTVFGRSISLNNRINRRLEMLEKGAGREQVLEQMEDGQPRDEDGDSVKEEEYGDDDDVNGTDMTTTTSRFAYDAEQQELRTQFLATVNAAASRRGESSHDAHGV